MYLFPIQSQLPVCCFFIIKKNKTEKIFFICIICGLWCEGGAKVCEKFKSGAEKKFRALRPHQKLAPSK